MITIMILDTVTNPDSICVIVQRSDDIVENIPCPVGSTQDDIIQAVQDRKDALNATDYSSLTNYVV